MNDVEMEIAEEQQIANNRAAAVGIPNGILLGGPPPAAAAAGAAARLNPPQPEDMDPERLQVNCNKFVSLLFVQYNRWPINMVLSIDSICKPNFGSLSLSG